MPTNESISQGMSALSPCSVDHGSPWPSSPPSGALTIRSIVCRSFSLTEIGVVMTTTPFGAERARRRAFRGEAPVREGAGERGGSARDVEPLEDVLQVFAHGVLADVEP